MKMSRDAAIRCGTNQKQNSPVANPCSQSQTTMNNFLLNALKARHAVISKDANDSISIEILMMPFLFNQELVDQSIRLDGIALPSDVLRDLAGKSFEFPINPVEGYIDGSIYLENRHQPVDVTLLSFSQSRDGKLNLIVKGIYMFDLGEYGQFSQPFTLAAIISSCAV